MGRKSVLVVEDDPGQGSAYVSMFKLCGYAAIHALNGRDALELFKSDTKKFGVVITDLNMSGMSGLELCTELNAISSVPVLLCSGSREVTSGEDVRLNKFKKRFQKPIDFMQVLESVRTCLA